MDCVIQGNISEASKRFVENCLQSGVFDRTIISCWESDDVDWASGLTVIKNKDVENPGTGNRNRQIHSSLAGIKEAGSGDIARFRSDQIISIESLKVMRDFYLSQGEPKLPYLDGELRKKRICVAGIFKPFPFHPRDHIFFGDRRDMIKLFDIAQCRLSGEPDYNTMTRAESYIGCNYASRFFEDFLLFCENPSDYLSDSARNRSAAMKISDIYRDELFTAFPRIKFSWPKHSLKEYHYHVTQTMGEYWNEDARWKF